MEIIVFLEKNSKHFTKFMELVRNNPEIKIKEVKKIVSHSSYTIIIKKLYSINKHLREIDNRFYLAEPSFSIAQSSVFTSLKRCNLVKIESKQDFYILKYEK